MWSITCKCFVVQSYQMFSRYTMFILYSICSVAIRYSDDDNAIDASRCQQSRVNLWPLYAYTLQGRHNERYGVPNHQRLDSLLNRLFGRRSKKTSNFRDTGLCEGNSPVTGEFPSQRASNAENISIWWRHHDHREGWLCTGRVTPGGKKLIPKGFM